MSFSSIQSGSTTVNSSKVGNIGIEWVRGKEKPKWVVDMFEKADTTKICKYEVDSKYAKNSVRKTELLFFVTRPHKLAGFATVKKYGKQSAYIELICSNVAGYGSALLKVIESTLKKAGFKVLYLFSLPRAEGFYRKFGYTETDEPCAGANATIKRKGNDDNGYRYTKCLGEITTTPSKKKSKGKRVEREVITRRRDTKPSGKIIMDQKKKAKLAGLFKGLALGSGQGVVNKKMARSMGLSRSGQRKYKDMYVDGKNRAVYYYSIFKDGKESERVYFYYRVHNGRKSRVFL